jgi:hypothetical protein
MSKCRQCFRIWVQLLSKHCAFCAPTSGAHRCSKTYSRILLVPSTKPLIQGEYAATTWCRPPHFLQHCRTLLFLKCFPPSDMNASAGANPPYMSSSDLTIVLPVPADLNLYPQTCCVNVSRYSPTETRKSLDTRSISLLTLCGSHINRPSSSRESSSLLYRSQPTLEYRKESTTP